MNSSTVMQKLPLEPAITYSLNKGFWFLPLHLEYLLALCDISKVFPHRLRCLLQKDWPWCLRSARDAGLGGEGNPAAVRCAHSLRKHESFQFLAFAGLAEKMSDGCFFKSAAQGCSGGSGELSRAVTAALESRRLRPVLVLPAPRHGDAPVTAQETVSGTREVSLRSSSCTTNQ